MSYPTFHHHNRSSGSFLCLHIIIIIISVALVGFIHVSVVMDRSLRWKVVDLIIMIGGDWFCCFEWEWVTDWVIEPYNQLSRFQPYTTCTWWLYSCSYRQKKKILRRKQRQKRQDAVFWSCLIMMMIDSFFHHYNRWRGNSCLFYHKNNWIAN